MFCREECHNGAVEQVISGGKLLMSTALLARALLADEVVAAAERLVEALTIDDSGSLGTGGNGGLLSRETIRKADELRVLLLRWRK